MNPLQNPTIYNELRQDATIYNELRQAIAERQFATTTSDNVVGGFSPLTPQQAALALRCLPSRTGKVAWVVDGSHDPHDGEAGLRLPVDNSPAKLAKLVTSS